MTGHSLLQPKGAIGQIGDLHLNPQKVKRGGRDAKSRHCSFLNHINQPHRPGKQVIGGRLTLVTPDAQASTGIALGIHVNQQDFFANSRQCGGQIDGGCGLAYPALLVGKGYGSWSNIAVNTHQWVRIMAYI